jgi:GT2 family glycosyltransferase
MLSVLIVNWNTRDLLASCLESLAMHPFQGGQEVIVVDNASTDGSAQLVQERFPWVRLLQSPKNLGYAQGNNLAFGAASGDLLLTLNPDTEVTPGCLNSACGRLLELNHVGVLSVRFIGPDGNLQAGVRGLPSARGIIGDLTGIGLRMPGTVWDSYRLHHFDYEVEQDAPQPMGTFLLFKREALAAIGDPSSPFDPQFPIFFNEVDLLYRLKQAGWLCRYLPSARILHHGGMSTRQVRAPMIWESHKSLVRYFRKHLVKGAGWLGWPLFVAVVYLAALVRARGYHAGFRP